MIIAATDGSALGNPGPGGWAWVTEDGQIGFGSEVHATNNQMELRAVLELLRFVDPAETLTIQADSEYAVNIFTVWLPGWRERGMRTSAGKPVKNADLIDAIDLLLQGRDVRFEWVRGHAGHVLNERADAIANAAAELAASEVDEASETDLVTTVEGWPLAKRLLAHAALFEHKANGAARDGPIGEVGLRVLVHDLQEAADALTVG
jgi:ribonuclease HI